MNKEQLKNSVPQHMALTGRIEDWLNDKHKARLPVSCTVYSVYDSYISLIESLLFTSHCLRFSAGVALDLSKLSTVLKPKEDLKTKVTLYLDSNNPEAETFFQLLGNCRYRLKEPNTEIPSVYQVRDTMEGVSSIEASWVYLINKLLENEEEIHIDLSKLRPVGTDNGKGLISSGVVSFSKFYEKIYEFIKTGSLTSLMSLYSTINQELRRGGVYKNGAITLFLDLDHKNIKEYLNCSSSDAPWVKRAVYLPNDKNVSSNSNVDLLLEKVNKGLIWLAKKAYNNKGDRLYSNVCLEVLLPHRGSCLLSSVNLGSVGTNFYHLPKIFENCMEWLCQLHPLTGLESDDYYLSPYKDKQVGLGVIGLSNLLAINGISYRDFTYALCEITRLFSASEMPSLSSINPSAYSLATTLLIAYEKASDVAIKYGMERAFAIAPTATMSYRYQDADGFTCSPEISPPIGREVDRDSATFGVQTFEYHPKCEIAKDTKWDMQWLLLSSWQKLMNVKGLAHAISANIWNSKLVDENFLQEFIDSPLITTYYRININQEALDKCSLVVPMSECSSCG